MNKNNKSNLNNKLKFKKQNQFKTQAKCKFCQKQVQTNMKSEFLTVKSKRDNKKFNQTGVKVKLNRNLNKYNILSRKI